MGFYVGQTFSRSMLGCHDQFFTTHIAWQKKFDIITQSIEIKIKKSLLAMKSLFDFVHCLLSLFGKQITLKIQV